MKGSNKAKSTHSKTQVVNLIKKQPVPDRKKYKSENITSWETSGATGENNFPQQLLQNVYNSPCGSAAVELWHEFVKGSGFVNSELDDIQVNSNQNLVQFTNKTSSDFSSMWGFACIVSYNSLGEKTAFTHLPFESCRLGEINDQGFTDKIYYNPYYGTEDYNEKYTICYNTYNPSAVLSEMADHSQKYYNGEVDYLYRGQVFWYAIEKPLARVYPQPSYYSAISWFQLDASIQKFHVRNVDNNFFVGALMSKFGDPDAGAGHQDDSGDFESTVGEEFSRQMQDFAGAENASGIMVDWFTEKENRAEITPFPNNTNDSLFSTLQEEVTKQIAIGSKCPRILLNIQTSGKLGDSQEIINAVKIMQGNTKFLRDELSNQYKILFNGFEGFSKETDYTIRNANPFDILPDWAIEVLTPEEKRKKASEMFDIELEETVITSQVEPETIITDD